MLSREGKQTDRGAVGAEFIGYNRRRREALLLQEFPHQPNCRPSVPAGLNQEIQDFALTVHGTPEIELPPSNYDDHLVQVPAFGRSWPPTLNPPRIGPTEFQDPSSNCLIRDVETTLGKQVLNVPIAQRETAIEPDGMLDDDRWKAVTTVGYLAHPEMLKHRPCRSHAVNVTMPIRATLPAGVPLILAPVTSGKTLLHSIEERGRFPSPAVRWCTSSLKRGPIERELRRYLKAHPRFGGRIVSAMGMRAEESAARAFLFGE